MDCGVRVRDWAWFASPNAARVGSILVSPSLCVLCAGPSHMIAQSFAAVTMHSSGLLSGPLQGAPAHNQQPVLWSGSTWGQPKMAGWSESGYGQVAMSASGSRRACSPQPSPPTVQSANHQRHQCALCSVVVSHPVPCPLALAPLVLTDWSGFLAFGTRPDQACISVRGQPWAVP